MSTSGAPEFPNMLIPDLGDPNATASGEVAGAVNSIAVTFKGHNHTVNNGAAVPFDALEGPATLDMTRDRAQGGGFGPAQPIANADFLSFVPRASAGTPNNSIFVDSSDGKLKFRDGTGTLKTVQTV